MINYQLSKKFKLLENGEFDHLTIILTIWGRGSTIWTVYIRSWLTNKSPPLSYIHLPQHLIVGKPFCWCRLDLTLYSLRVLTTKTELKGKMRKVLRLSGRAPRVLVHLHRWVLFVWCFKLCSGADRWGP